MVNTGKKWSLIVIPGKSFNGSMHEVFGEKQIEVILMPVYVVL